VDAVIYTRTATVAQTRDDSALIAQERACEALADERGWRVVRRIRDVGQSGLSMERPGLTELRAVVQRAEATVVVACDLDRLARSSRELGLLIGEFQSVGARLELAGPLAGDLG